MHTYSRCLVFEKHSASNQHRMEGLGPTIQEDLVVETEELDWGDLSLAALNSLVAQQSAPTSRVTQSRKFGVRGMMLTAIWICMKVILHTRCSRQTTASWTNSMWGGYSWRVRATHDCRMFKFSCGRGLHSHLPGVQYLSDFTWDDFFRNTPMRYTLEEQSGHCDVPMGQNPSQPNARSLHSPAQRMDEQRRHDPQYGT